MAQHVQVQHNPTAADVAAIMAARGKPDKHGRFADVVVVCSAARTIGSRRAMRQRLCHAGLPGNVAAVLGWSTTMPPASKPAEAPVPAPSKTPTETVAAVEPDPPAPLPALEPEPAEADEPGEDSGRSSSRRKRNR